MKFKFRKKSPEEELNVLIDRLEMSDYILTIHPACGRLVWEKYWAQKDWRIEIMVEFEYDELTQTAENERIRIIYYINGERAGSYRPVNMNECVRIIRRIMNGEHDEDSE